MNINTFCDVQGIGKADRWTLEKMYAKTDLSYEDWHKNLSAEFAIGDKKVGLTPPSTTSKS